MTLYAVRLETQPELATSDDLDRIIGLEDETLVMHLALGLDEHGSLIAHCEVEAATPLAAAQQASLWLRSVVAGLEETQFVELGVALATVPEALSRERSRSTRDKGRMPL